jgi:hypothetical protein
MEEHSPSQVGRNKNTAKYVQRETSGGRRRERAREKASKE